MKVIQRYKKFLIKENDHFDESNYLKLQDDLESIKAAISHLPADHRTEMIISFAKNKFLEKEWIATNPLLAEKINLNSLDINFLRELFDSSSANEMFSQELEAYIKKMLN